MSAQVFTLFILPSSFFLHSKFRILHSPRSAVTALQMLKIPLLIGLILAPFKGVRILPI